MSVSSTTNRVSYTGNGATSVYAYPFKIFANTELRVTKKLIAAPYTETLLVLTTDYTVSGVGETSGGNVTLVAGSLASTYKLFIRRVRALKQQTDIRNQGPGYQEAIENEFDKQLMIAQQHADELDRSVKLSEAFTSASFDPTLPPALVGAVSCALVTSAAGTGFAVGPTTDDISNAQGYANAADASADAAATSQSAAASSASAASTSASDAATSASAASTSATAAASSATTASTQATNAASSATTASTQATNAASSATTATTQASAASTSASGAATSASGAATSATNAATSATNAATSATAAASSATSAAADAAATLYRWGGSAGGTGDTLTLTPSPALGAYGNGVRYVFLATATNTGAATINISGLGAKSLKLTDGTALSSGVLASGSMFSATYDGTNFRVHELVSVPDGSVTRSKMATGGIGAGSVTASKTTTYSIASTDDVVRCDATSGSFTVTLPTAASISGRVYTIKRTDQTLGNAVTIATTSSQTIDGVTTRKLMTQYEQFTVVSDGSNWQVVSHTYPSGWTSYTPTLTSTGGGVVKGAVTTDTAYWMRIGDSIRIRREYKQSGTGTAGTGHYRESLPSGLTIGSNVTNDVGNGCQSLGSGYTYDGTSNGFNCVVQPGGSSTTLALAFGTAAARVGAATLGDVSRASVQWGYEAIVPITNWEA